MKVKGRDAQGIEFTDDVRVGARVLHNAIKKSVAHIDGISAKELKAALAEAQAGMGGS